MSALMENNTAIIDAQRYAMISALFSGASSLSNERSEALTIERSNNYNPVILFSGRELENNCQHLKLAYNSLNKKTSGFNHVYQLSTDATDYFAAINEVTLASIKLNQSLIGSNSSFEKDEVVYRVKTVLDRVILLESENERVASRFLMRSIERKLKYKDVIYINEMLKNISLMEFSPRCLVSALRSTYRFKHSLFMWRFALQSVERRLSAKGLDSHAWLIGLTDD
ncbi:MAG: hypothetical protein E7A42_02660 [Leclercia adecarboxylata]|nr:hypothetical protein [Leclercia adecarboxylata]